MSDKPNKKHNSHSKKSINQYKPINYFIVPFVYAAILLIVALPVELKLKDTVNELIVEGYKNADEYSYYDELTIDRKLPLSNAQEGETTYAPIAKNENYGVLIAEASGLKCDVFKGIDGKANLREGVGSVDAIPGGKMPTYIYGYSTKHFKKLKNIKVGENVIFNTTYGKYTYKVNNILVSDDVKNVNAEDNSLVLYCNNSSDVFASNNNEKLFVIAELVSGPKAMEEVK